jgi:hypothetical protein
LKIRNSHILPGIILFLALSSCNKSAENILDNSGPTGNSPGFIKYVIKAGQQYSEQSVFQQTNYDELKFVVKFDSSAIYRTLSPNNQLDINKLYGFADNNDDHHHFSARFGWRWSDGALRLFAYTYNKGEMNYEELTTVDIGAEYTCAIKVSGSQYIFSLNGQTKSMPRFSTTTTAIGYKLYPYFGGDETAPHDIRIFIKEF